MYLCMYVYVYVYVCVCVVRVVCVRVCVCVYTSEVHYVASLDGGGGHWCGAAVRGLLAGLPSRGALSPSWRALSRARSPPHAPVVDDRSQLHSAGRAPAFGNARGREFSRRFPPAAAAEGSTAGAGAGSSIHDPSSHPWSIHDPPITSRRAFQMQTDGLLVTWPSFRRFAAMILLVGPRPGRGRGALEGAPETPPSGVLLLLCTGCVALCSAQLCSAQLSPARLGPGPPAWPVAALLPGPQRPTPNTRAQPQPYRRPVIPRRR
jgi:hypothetical protein